MVEGGPGRICASMDDSEYARWPGLSFAVSVDVKKKCYKIGEGLRALWPL
jgi:hypothetical protein